MIKNEKGVSGLSEIRLMQGDCLEVMKDIPDGSVDFILTDPPYGTTACKWDSVIPFEPMWEQIWRVLKPNGACALFGSEPFSSFLRISQLEYFKYDWIWEKPTASNFCLAKRQPLKQHEIISVFYKKQADYNPQMQEREGSGEKRVAAGYKNTMNYVSGEKSEVAAMVSQDVKRKAYDGKLRYPKSIQKTVGKSDKGLHPTQKPVALLEYLIKTYTLEGETVLDFTAGSFSTGVAAVNLNRSFIGIEQDEKYFEIGKKRVDEARKAKQ